MTKKPKKKPFRITGPGLYRTRDGRKVFVSAQMPIASPPLYAGLVEGSLYASRWFASGGSSGSDSFGGADLISRWPGKKAKKARRK